MKTIGPGEAADRTARRRRPSGPRSCDRGLLALEAPTGLLPSGV